VAKELNAYEREWELIRKQRMDTLSMQIERAKKERDARMVEVRTAINKAREDVAKVLQERETEAQKVRWEIEARGRGQLTSAENEARALRHLGEAYQENRAVLQYELARQRLQVAESLVQQAPRPVLVRSEGGDSSALSTLLMAQLLPGMMRTNGGSMGAPRRRSGGSGAQRPHDNGGELPDLDQMLRHKLDEYMDEE
jgi:regulator of protease activity HflC (stomatin/prohibitin superfamily)